MNNKILTIVRIKIAKQDCLADADIFK